MEIIGRQIRRVAQKAYVIVNWEKQSASGCDVTEITGPPYFRFSKRPFFSREKRFKFEKIFQSFFQVSIKHIQLSVPNYVIS